ncbi:unnamed protein product, partial [Discosporangium mesarthrocarpum]
AIRGGSGGAGGAWLVVGLPVITSPTGLRFWLNLCCIGESNPVRLEAFAALSEEGRGAGGEGRRGGGAGIGGGGLSRGLAGGTTDSYGHSWFDGMFANLRGLSGEGGVAGVHIMAPGSGARRRAQALVDEG